MNDFALVRNSKDQKIESYDTFSLIPGKKGSIVLEGIHSSEGPCEHGKSSAHSDQHTLFIVSVVSAPHAATF